MKNSVRAAFVKMGTIHRFRHWRADGKYGGYVEDAQLDTNSLVVRRAIVNVLANMDKQWEDLKASDIHYSKSGHLLIKGKKFFWHDAHENHYVRVKDFGSALFDLLFVVWETAYYKLHKLGRKPSHFNCHVCR